LLFGAQANLIRFYWLLVRKGLERALTLKLAYGARVPKRLSAAEFTPSQARVQTFIREGYSGWAVSPISLPPGFSQGLRFTNLSLNCLNGFSIKLLKQLEARSFLSELEPTEDLWNGLEVPEGRDVYWLTTTKILFSTVEQISRS
jgi:hypothetical protein